MRKNIIDERKIFKTNQKIKTNLLKFNSVKVLVVDNFYENPYEVRKLALDIPASSNLRIRGNNPAFRVNAFYEFFDLYKIYDELAREYFPEIMENYIDSFMKMSFMRATFMVNVMQSTDLPAIAPHIDNPSGINLASVIYLNTENECNGGTGFYEYKNKSLVKENIGIVPKEYVTDSVDDWKLIGIADMKFNRMILYNQSVLHSAYVKPGMFEKDLYRINQQFYI